MLARNLLPGLAAVALASGAQSEELSGELRLKPDEGSYVAGESVIVFLPQTRLTQAEEYELLLQASGLAVELVRLTSSLFAPGSSVTFQIPNLPGAKARVVLRAGAGGREWFVAASQWFFIAGGNSPKIPALVHRQGEWWLEFSPWLPGEPLAAAWEGQIPCGLPGVFPQRSWPSPLGRQIARGNPNARRRRGPATLALLRSWPRPLSLPQRE